VSGQDEDRQGRLAAIRDEWTAHGCRTDPADRAETEWAVRAAIEAAGVSTHSMLFVWVESPMAGVLSSTYLGFALGGAVKSRMVKPLNSFLAQGSLEGRQLRRDVDGSVWRARNAVHAQVAADLEARGAPWERLRREIGDYTWDQVRQTVGDPLHSEGWEQQARASEGLFEENLATWADAMMEGQFDAGAMAQLDAMGLLGDVDASAFTGIRKTAANCCWWWPYEVGAVLCERPVRFEVGDEHVTVEFGDGWAVRT
jgi:hypothetical protein